MRGALVMWAVVAAAAAMIACVPLPHAEGAPVLERIAPDSIRMSSGAVVEVTIIGTGFTRGDPGENTVHFAGAAIRRVRANDAGTRIVLTVPDAIDSGGGAPPMPVTAGDYPVQVETAMGRSNVVMLRVFR